MPPILSSPTIDQVRDRRLSPVRMKRFWAFRAPEMGAQLTRKCGRSSVLEIPPWCGRNLQSAASHHKRRKLPPGSSSRPGSLWRFFPHHEAAFSPLLPEWPLVSQTLELGRHFHFRLETVTMVRYDLSKVVTDQKHDKQFFHEGSHV